MLPANSYEGFETPHQSQKLICACQVDAFHRQLDELTTTLSSIHSTYTSSEAPRQINISHSLTKRISSDVRQSAHFILPSLESIFAGATDHVEKLLATDIYPRFVRHQVTAVATAALADHRERFQGLGDCFCLTDPGYVYGEIWEKYRAN